MHLSCLQEAVRIRHDNDTGRWVSPFRPAWGPGSDCFLCGDMRRGLGVFDAATGKEMARLVSEHMTAIPARVCVHPTLPVLAGGTCSGRINIWR